MTDKPRANGELIARVKLRRFTVPMPAFTPPPSAPPKQR
jgi:hypothetical protein